MARSGAYKLEVGYFIYIGSSNDVDYRRACHVTMLRKGTHPNPKLQFAWNQCPEKVELSTLRPLKRKEGESDGKFRNRLRAAEQELLDHFSSDPRLTNLSLDARGPDKRPDMKARWRDPDFRERMMTRLREREFGAETRAKMSEAKRGMMNPKSRPVRVIWPDGRDEVFPTVFAAAQEIGVSQQVVDLWLRGKVALPGRGVRPCKKPHLVGLRVEYAD